MSPEGQRVVSALNEGHNGAGTDGTAVVDIVIVGAGIAGLATAVALHRIGLRCLIFEQASGLRQEGSALSLWDNGWRALEALGVADKLRRDYLPLTRIEIMTYKGRLLREFTIEEAVTVDGSHEVRGVHRAKLLATLAEELPSGTILFGAKPASFEEGSSPGTTTVVLENGRRVTCRILLGCDGTWSAVARWVGARPVQYCGYASYRGIAEYPENHNLDGSIRFVYGCELSAGMYPLTEKQVYWFVGFNAAEDEGRKLEGINKKQAALELIKGWECGVDEAIRRSSEASISRSNVTHRYPYPFPGRWGKGGVSLLGDAAHPMTPNLGQGGCTTLEDAIILAQDLAAICTVEEVEQGRSRAGEQLADKVVSAGKSSGRGEPLLEGKMQKGGVAVLDRTDGEAEGQRIRRRVLGSDSDIERALGEFERKRFERTAPLAVKASIIGSLMQTPYALLRYVRDNIVVAKLLRVKGFLSHSEFDCGKLPPL